MKDMGKNIQKTFMEWVLTHLRKPFLVTMVFMLFACHKKHPPAPDPGPPLSGTVLYSGDLRLGEILDGQNPSSTDYLWIASPNRYFTVVTKDGGLGYSLASDHIVFSTSSDLLLADIKGVSLLSDESKNIVLPYLEGSSELKVIEIFVEAGKRDPTCLLVDVNGQKDIPDWGNKFESNGTLNAETNSWEYKKTSQTSGDKGHDYRPSSLDDFKAQFPVGWTEKIVIKDTDGNYIEDWS